MANGIQMMLKSLGLNPDEITTKITQFGELVVDLHARQVRCEEKLDRILAILENEKGLNDGRSESEHARGNGAAGAGAGVAADDRQRGDIQSLSRTDPSNVERVSQPHHEG